MKCLLVLSLLVAAALATESNALDGYKTQYYSKCIGGTVIPAPEPYATGPCQINSDCFQSCLVACHNAQFDLVSSSECVAPPHKKSHKQSYGYNQQGDEGMHNQQKSLGYGKNRNTHMKRDGYQQNKQCQCCCTNFPTCNIGQLVVSTANANPLVASCSGTLVGECESVCQQTNPCASSAAGSGVYAEQSFCIRQETMLGTGPVGTCACCCDFSMSGSGGTPGCPGGPGGACSVTCPAQIGNGTTAAQLAIPAGVGTNLGLCIYLPADLVAILNEVDGVLQPLLDLVHNITSLNNGGLTGIIGGVTNIGALLNLQSVQSLLSSLTMAITDLPNLLGQLQNSAICYYSSSTGNPGTVTGQSLVGLLGGTCPSAKCS